MKTSLLLILFMTQIVTLFATQRSWRPGAYKLLQPAERKPARTAVLIMALPDGFDVNLKGYADCRWHLGKKV